MNLRNSPGPAPDQAPWIWRGSAKHLGLITLSVLLVVAFFIWLI